MDGAERSRERIEDALAALEDVYGPFPVNQTTVSLPADRYASLRDRRADGWVRAYLEVRNENEEVLHVGGGEDPELPCVDGSLEGNLTGRLRRAVERRTGVEPSIDGLVRATIQGIRNADRQGMETLYHVVLVFTGTRVAGVAGENAEWHDAGSGLAVR